MFPATRGRLPERVVMEMWPYSFLATRNQARRPAQDEARGATMTARADCLRQKIVQAWGMMALSTKMPTAVMLQCEVRMVWSWG